MFESKITIPLYLSIIVTFLYNLAPILLGYGSSMDLMFLLYSGTMYLLSNKDKRVLGYATVLSASNLANTDAHISYSLLLGILTITKEQASFHRIVRNLWRYFWWRMFLMSFVLVILSVPFWDLSINVFITEVKQALSRLGYIVVLSLAVGLTIYNPKDGVRLVGLLCIVAFINFVLFYFLGSSSYQTITATPMGTPMGVWQRIGKIDMNFVRTQVCIPIAVIAAICLVLVVSNKVRWRFSFFIYLAMISCLYMIIYLASTGSALAMTTSVVYFVFIYIYNRRTIGDLARKIFMLMIICISLYSLFMISDIPLLIRLDDKIHAGEIDRMVYWKEGVNYIFNTPYGVGWTSRDVGAHSDYLLYFIAYGWPSGVCYLFGGLFLLLWQLHKLSFNGYGDRNIIILLFVGSVGYVVYFVNSIFDMLSANIGYFQVVWALIVTPLVISTMVDSSSRIKRYNYF